jgi:demethylmenaquinone methyltransferase/2-methoxy-6-polyprenyl-1,4-benzoquinol methylase
LITSGFGIKKHHQQRKSSYVHYASYQAWWRLLILEFSKPNELISPFYDFISFKRATKLGDWVVNDADSYQYLAESIRMHPDQKKLKAMMETIGFSNCEYFNLTGGIVALHIGYKILTFS